MAENMISESRAIPPFRCEEIARNQLSKEWKSWKSSLEVYFEAFDVVDQRKMKALLLHFGGRQLQKVFGNLPDVDKIPLVATKVNWYDLAISKLDDYFEPGRQYILERCRLRKMKQAKNERFSHFMMRIRQQLADCGLEKFSTEVREILTEIFLTDAIVEGCESEELRRRILQKDRSLAELEELGAMMEGVEQQMKDISSLNPNESNIEKVFKVESRFVRKSTTSGRAQRKLEKKPYDARKMRCFSCGIDGHISSSLQCKARDQKCRKCDKRGHFEAVCGKRYFNKRDVNFKHQEGKIRLITEIKDEFDDKAEEIVAEDAENVPEKKSKTYYCFYSGNETNLIECVVGDVPLKLLIDSGSDANLIPLKVWEEILSRSINETRVYRLETNKGLNFYLSE
ncbi:uncharacterized protein LOC129743226 [Uranotaenia lowii]|uniref:uncharacterized protein LOC129743226 n=1 Tax=Uranotaenia lowii TaxID=190385 RepID=UPI002478CE7A|nr:uncharacterized protein LOC129743226 [Uranotaenia lowii]